MKKLLIFLCAIFLLFGMSGVAGAAPKYVYDGGLGAWSDANKTNPTGSPDGLLCWAAAASNSLAWTGWDGGFTSAEGIFAEFVGDWAWSRTGNAMYAYDWWFTTNTSSSYTEVPGPDYVFDAAGRGYYSQALYDSEHGWYPENVPTDNYQYFNDAISGYIDDDRGIVISAYDAPHDYSHSLSVWGLDPDLAVMQIYVTDSDNGYGLDTYNFTQHADNYWYIDNYTDAYNDLVDLKILEVHRLNMNVDGIDPNDGNGPGVEPVPEPATLFLLGSGLMGLFGLGRKKFFRS